MKQIITVIGPGETATPNECRMAYELGRQIAQEGWVLLSGGRAAGVMDAASRGAKAADGLTVGILPGSDRTGASEAVDIAICTGLGQARNILNVLSAKVVIACGMGAGTASEVALALKSMKPVVLISIDEKSLNFFNLSQVI